LVAINFITFAWASWGERVGSDVHVASGDAVKVGSGVQVIVEVGVAEGVTHEVAVGSVVFVAGMVRITRGVEIFGLIPDSFVSVRGKWILVQPAVTAIRLTAIRIIQYFLAIFFDVFIDIPWLEQTQWRDSRIRKYRAIFTRQQLIIGSCDPFHDFHHHLPLFIVDQKSPRFIINILKIIVFGANIHQDNSFIQILLM
jgi:membrane-associated protease RseP (regulator of RpoE activity)